MQGAGAAGSGSARRRVLELCFSPICRQPGCTSVEHSTQQFQLAAQQQLQQQVAQQLVVPGGFSLLQEFELAGSRAFDLDVEGTLLTVAEVSGGGAPPPMAINRLRRVSGSHKVDISIIVPCNPVQLTFANPLCCAGEALWCMLDAACMSA
jgi:hypothetical protein